MLARPAWFGRFSRRPGLTFVGFLLLALGMTSPMLLYPQQMMLDSGAGSDAFIGTWNLWWTRIALEQGQNPFFTDALFAPHGTSLALHTHSVTYGVASLPAQWLLGSQPPRLFLAYNLMVWLSFTLTGYLTYRLAFAQTRSRSGALLAGVILAFINFRFANTVRLHILAMEWLVLFVWAWLALLSRPSPRRLVYWMGSGVLLLHSSLEYTAYSVPLLVILGVASWWKHHTSKESVPTYPVGAWLRLGAPAFLINLALLWPFLSQLLARRREGHIGFDPGFAEHFSADLLDFFLLNPRHPLWGSTFESLSAGFHGGDGGYGLSLGWVALILFAWASLRLLRACRGRVWVLGFAFFAALSLGPVLHVGGKPVASLPMPQPFVATILPFLGASRTPIRYAAPAALCLSVAIAWAWAQRGQRGADSAPGRLSRAEILLGSLILFESLAGPMRMTPQPIPQVYTYLRVQGGDPRKTKDALLHLPPLSARENLLYQTVHERPLVESVESAVPQRSPSGATLAGSPEMRALLLLRRPGIIEEIDESQRTLTLRGIQVFLEENRIGWIVVRPEATQEAYRENLRFLQPRDEQEIDGYVLFRF